MKMGGGSNEKKAQRKSQILFSIFKEIQCEFDIDIGKK